MKQILQDHFKDKIIFTDIAGMKNVITFRTTASSILHDYYIHDKDACEDTEAVNLIEAAAKLIKQLKKAKTIRICNSTETATSFLRESLKSFTKILIVGTNKKSNEKKQASLGQALVQATRLTSDWISHTNASPF